MSGYVVASLVVGYLLGRIRPFRRAFEATDWWLITGWPKWMPLWLVFACWGSLHPRRAWRAWRHRHDPPKPRMSTEHLFRGFGSKP